MDCKKVMDDIWAYNCRIDLLYSDWARRHGMSYYTLIVLFALWGNAPCTQKKITEERLLPKQTVHTVIKELQKKGYVTLTTGRNQKEKLVTFTALGEKEIPALLKETERLEERVLKRFGEQNCQLLANSFRKFADIFEEEMRNDGT